MVPAEKACSNIVFVYKAYYKNYILNELGMNSTLGNRIYTVTTLSKNEILKNHISVLNALKIPVNETDQNKLQCL